MYSTASFLRREYLDRVIRTSAGNDDLSGIPHKTTHVSLAPHFRLWDKAPQVNVKVVQIRVSAMLEVQPRLVHCGHALMFGKHGNFYARVLNHPSLEVDGFCRGQRREGIIFVIHSTENQEAAAIAHGDGSGPGSGLGKVSVRNPFVAVVKVARSVKQEILAKKFPSSWRLEAA